jgi:hypothetical protein
LSPASGDVRFYRVAEAWTRLAEWLW